jgi:large subunit ribosomal protein L21
MKKAVITTGGKQYLVSEGDELEVEKIADAKPVFQPLLVIRDADIEVGKPTVAGAKVTADVIEPEILADKVVSIRYKAKKRVRKIRGHRQRLSRIKITRIV